MHKEHDPAPQRPLLEVAHLRVWFPTETNWLGTPVHFLRAVEDVSFNLMQGEVLGLMGESGCGKSAICQAIMGLQEVESGQIFYDGRDLVHLDTAGRRAIRREVQMIFQHPAASLNPKLTIGEALREPLAVHRIVSRAALTEEVQRLLRLVDLPGDAAGQYPQQFEPEHQLRIVIARALALHPKLLICDDPLAGLDADAQAEMLRLLAGLRTELGLSILFTAAQRLAALRGFADRVVVMRQGQIVERGSAEEVLGKPQQEYTKRLVEATL